MKVTDFIETKKDSYKKQEKKKSIVIFTPSIDGKMFGGATESLVASSNLMIQDGYLVTFAMLTKCPYLHHARNVACKMAIVEDYDYLLFLDSDVHFEYDAILKLIKRDKDICVAAYPHKSHDKKTFVFTFLPNKKVNKSGLLEIENAGTGFMLIKTSLLKKMYHKTKDYIYTSNYGHNKNDNEEEYYKAFFDFSYDETSRLISEDWFFCNKVRNEFQIKIYLDTTIKLRHEGYETFKHDLNDYLIKSGIQNE